MSRSAALKTLQLLVVSSALTAAVDGLAASESVIRAAALPNSPLYTAPDGTQFGSLALPSIDGLGRVAFRTTDSLGVFREAGNGAFLQAARQGELATGTSAAFKRLLGVSVSDSGQPVFLGHLQGPSVDASNDSGIWSVSASGQPRLVVRAGDQAASLENGTFFGTFATEYDFDVGLRNGVRFVVNGGGQVAFQSQLVGPEAVDANDRAIFVETAAGLRVAARRGDAAPGFSDGATIGTFFVDTGAPSINDRGSLAFMASLDGTPHFQGIFSEGDDHELNLVAKRNDPVPGVGGGATLAAFRNPRIDNTGDVVFQGFLGGSDINTGNDEVILAGRPNALRLIAREGSDAVDAGLGTLYDTFRSLGVSQARIGGGPIIGGGGRVAFSADLKGLNTDGGNNSGIWLEDANGDLELIAREGTSAPGGGVFGDLGAAAIQMNSGGRIAFLGDVLISDGWREQGIWAQDRHGSLQLIVRSDQVITGDPPFSAAIGWLAFGDNSGGQDGSAVNFNDRGDIVFWADYRIFVSSLVAVPEPSAAALILVGLLGLGGRRVVGCRALRL